MTPRILIISPVRNEARHIERVAAALAAQALAPDRWVVLDDASTDDTRRLLANLAGHLPFMSVHDLDRRSEHAGARDRLARAAAPRNFNVGLATVDWMRYSHVMKLDGDIELSPDYLRALMERFAADPQLGLAGGVLVEPQPGGEMRPISIPRHHVHGALKCYSRECLVAIGGVQERLGWDTIDETCARMRGFSTVSFEDLVSIHHRPWGSADGALRGRVRLGECAYITNYPLSWVLMRSAKLAGSRPRIANGLAYLYGYVRAAVGRRERVRDPEYRRFTRRELRRRLADMATGRGAGMVVARPGAGSATSRLTPRGAAPRGRGAPPSREARRAGAVGHHDAR